MAPQPSRHDVTGPSAWIARFAGLVPAGAEILDVATGGGRHSRFFVQRNNPVTAVDRDISALRGVAGIDALEIDLEDGNPWPFADRRFGGVIVTNYLHRPILPGIVGAVAPGGALLYETFAVGNERFGKPSSPAFLLRPGELLDAVRGRLRVIAYEDVELAEPKPAMVQRIAAVNRS